MSKQTSILVVIVLMIGGSSSMAQTTDATAAAEAASPRPQGSGFRFEDPEYFCLYDGKLFSIGAYICTSGKRLMSCFKQENLPAKWNEEPDEEQIGSARGCF